ncbi:MAG TPA: PP2C family protein-serine/threonine phosphatase [Mycobacteriales bacterium]|nr:PP2C family protein-serine/threonine phosphatase [Mycobacteriales bacterium]
MIDTDMADFGTTAPDGLETDSSTMAGLVVAGRYLPLARRGEPSAGDFYDVVELLPSCYLIAVGDVSGHGPGAAGRMRRLRAAARALAAKHASVTEMLRRLDRMQAEGDPDDIATLWLGAYHHETGVLRYASAGHLPPILAFPEGRTTLLREATAPPLGTGLRTLSATHEVMLPMGATLVAYSDGLVERPGCDLDAQLELVRRIVHTATQGGCGPDEVADAIVAAMVPDSARARDDVCVVVIRRVPSQ